MSPKLRLPFRRPDPAISNNEQHASASEARTSDPNANTLHRPRAEARSVVELAGLQKRSLRSNADQKDRAIGSRRPVTYGAHSAGLGTTVSIDLPDKFVPRPRESELGDAPRSVSLEEGDDLARRLELMPSGLTELPASDGRPQRSRPMSGLMKVPGIKGIIQPKSPQELLTGRKAGDVSSDAGQVGELLETLTQGFEDSHAQYAEALDKLLAAESALHMEQLLLANARECGRTTAVATKERAVAQMQEAVDRAKDELTPVIAGMREDISAFRSLDLGVQVLASDLLDRKVSAFHNQVSFLRNAVAADKENLPKTIDRLKLQRSEVMTSQQASYQSVYHLRERVTRLESRLSDARDLVAVEVADHARRNELADLALGPEGGSETEGRSEPVVLTDAQVRVADLESQIADAKQSIEDLDRERASLSPVLEYLDAEIGRLEQFHSNEAGRFNDVARSLRNLGVSVGKTSESVKRKLESNLAAEHKLSAAHTQLIAASAPGFSVENLGSRGAPLLTKLAKLANYLPEDDFKGERILPRAAAIEMISRSLAIATNGDVEKAAALADALTSRPLNHWVPTPQNRSARDVPFHVPNGEMEALLSTMASVPRGLDALNLIAGKDTEDDTRQAPLEVGQRDALQAYWQASNAMKTEPDEVVKVWLSQAMNVAAHEVRNKKNDTVFPTADVPLKEQAAYRAVRNGFLSNAAGSDYDLSNKNLLNLTNTIADQKPRQSRLLRWAPHSLNPAEAASPFRPVALKLAQKQMEAQGMPTLKTKADADIQQTFVTLGELANGHLKHLEDSTAGNRNRNTSLADAQISAAIAAISEFVRENSSRSGPRIRFPVSPNSLNLRSPITPKSFGQSKRLYDSRFDAKDIKTIRARASELSNASAEAFPPALDRVLGQKRPSIIDVMGAIHADLSASSEETKSALKGGLDILNRDFPRTEREDGVGISRTGLRQYTFAPQESMKSRVAFAKTSTINSKDDVEKFFRPMLETARMRDQVTLTGGGTIGIGIPILAPVTPNFPLSAQAHIASKRSEAFLQFKNPTFSAELSTGSVVTVQRDAGVSVGYRVGLGPASFVASGNVKAEKTESKTIYTNLRTLRGKDDSGNRKVQEAIDDNLKVLDILLRWQDKTDANGNAYEFTDPLQAIFALSPTTLVASGEKDASTLGGTIEARGALRGRAPGHQLSAGVSATPFSLGLSKAREKNSERTGFLHQRVLDHNDQASQRIGVAAKIGVIATPYKHSFTKGHINTPTGTLESERTGRGHLSLAGDVIEYSRELVSNFEKNGATTFPIGDNVGGSVDRAYGSPKDLLAEIEANREDWLIRCLDVLPRSKESESDTTERMSKATALLNDFIKDLREVGANPSFQFNIKYEMQPRMSGKVDGLRGIEALAEMQGEKATASQSRADAEQLLRHRASWAPKNMAVRSKGKTWQETGIDFFLRWQKNASAETSRAAFAFPV
jgi:hypothetical protein